jgi:hypothetical protein
MTFDDLTADAEIMRAGNDDSFNPDTFTDEILLELMKSAAKREMKLDLCDALSIEVSDTDKLDCVVDKHADRLAMALSYKQLSLYYQEIDEGDGSKANNRMKQYASKYGQIRATFPKLHAKTANTTTFVRIMR